MIYGILECISQTDMCIIHKENIRESMSITYFPGDMGFPSII